MSSGASGRSGGRARRDEWPAPARRTRSVRRGWWRRSVPSALRRASGPTRPTRCSATAIDRGEPICTPGRPCRYRSRVRAKRWPPGTFAVFQLRSASSRRARDRLPWCAVRRCGPAASPRWWATRSARRRVLTKTSVVRWARPVPRPVVDLIPHFVGGHGSEFVARHFHREVHLAAVAHVDDGRARSLRNSATSSSGLTVAESPMR